MQASSQGAGTKRLFSNRVPRLSVEPELQADHEDVHHTCSGKRNRSDNWPLLDTSPARPSDWRSPLGNRDAPNSYNPEWPRPVKRPSKFVEGSMNDRTSQKPDATYLGMEQDGLMENHTWEQAPRPRPQSCIPASNTSTTALPDVSRHSSIFRFGKTIAATFNPSNWKMFSKQDRTVNEAEVEDPQQKILRERQEKAEKIYAELKQTGHFPTIRAQNLEALLDRNTPVKHDSGVSFRDTRSTSVTRNSSDSQRSMSREDKRKGMIFLEPPSITSKQHRGLSPSMSNFSTPSRNSFLNLKRNSMSNIKKKFKYESNNDSAADLSVEDSAHRLPSRKDIQKQQKLVKRVSDLESKLEQARRKLYESPANNLHPPESRGRSGRRKFVPGAMPTLHSERLLAAYVPPEDEEDEESEIGRAITEDVVVEARRSLEDTRDRSRTVRERDVSPSHFYPPPALLTQEALFSQQTPLEHKRSLKLKHATVDVASDTNVSTEVSIVQSEYIERVATSDRESENFTVVESTSVMTPPELDTEDDVITPKGRGGVCTNATPKKLMKHPPTRKKASPAGKAATPVNIAPITRKRKTLADNSGVYQPSGDSTSVQSEVRPVKKETLKRKAMATSQTIPPRRLPPVPAAALTSKVVDSSTQEPASKVVKTGKASSPSSLAKQEVRSGGKSPVKTISRKAIPTSVAKPQTVDNGEDYNTKQATSPPPSIPTVNPELNLERSPDGQDTSSNVKDMKKIEIDQPDEPALYQEDADISDRYGRNRSPDIPPMPQLPKTVLLPSGEVVDVKSRTPVVATRASSRAGSQARSAFSVAKSGVVNKRDHKRAGKDDESEKKPAAMPGTRNSFEWPSDCF